MESLTFVAVLFCTGVVSFTFAQDVDFHAAKDVGFGLNPENEAWFEFVNERGERVRYTGLQHMPGLFAEDLQTTTYSVHKAKSDWATLTIIDAQAGLITATVHRSGTITTVAPSRDYHYLHETSANFRKLAPAKHVLTYNTGPWGGGSCLARHIDVGTAVAREAANVSAEIDVLSKETETETEGGETDAPKPRPKSRRRRRRLQRAPRWGNCYTGEGSTSYLDIGIVVDKNFHETYGGNVDRTMKAIEVIIANTNLVYFYTFNMFVRVRQVVIPLTGGSNMFRNEVYTMFNQDRASCGLSIGATLDAMSFYSQALPITTIQPLLPTTNREDPAIASMAHWHLLTACYASGTVGVAYVGTLCRTNLFTVRSTLTTAVNVAVSSRTFEGVTWLTFAHELGHSFNADHSFEEGQGSTGGIMDYGDGTLHGIYQFNERYRRGEVCNFLQSMVLSNRCTKSPAINYFPTLAQQPCTSGSLCADGTGECREGICELGELLVKITADGVETFYPFLQAAWGGSPFSTLANALSGNIIVASPPSGCSAPPTANAYAGTIVIVDRTRSVCTFQRKAELAEAAGAAALVIVNDEDKVVLMEASSAFFTSMPVVMVASGDGNGMKSDISGASSIGATLGMAVFPHPPFTFSPTFLGGPPTPAPDLIDYLVDNVFPYTAAGFGTLAGILFIYGFCFQPGRDSDSRRRDNRILPQRYP